MCRPRPICAAVFCIAFASLVACAESNVVIRARMLWLPQAEFAGFYVAESEGLYAAAGLDVAIEHPRPDEEIFDTLRDGETDVIVAWPLSALQRAAAGDDIVNVGQLAQRSALMFIARKQSGITCPEDMSGRRIGLWPTESLRSTLRSFLAHNSATNYTVVPVFTNVDLFLYGGVDVTVGVYYDEVYRLFAAGIDAEELTLFRLNDTFPKLADDGLYCTRATFEAHPEAYRKFLAATLEGWRRAFEDPAKTLPLVKAKCEAGGVPFSAAHQRWMLNTMRTLIFPDGGNGGNSGVFTRESFDESVRLLKMKGTTITYESFVQAAEGGVAR